MKLSMTSIKKHVMTGVSFMIPLVVGSGLCMAISVIFGGPNVAEQEGSFLQFVNSIGKMGLGTFVVPVICAAISYSIADKPGIAPALLVGFIASDIKAGFLGGILGGFFVGLFVNWLKKVLKNVPSALKGLVPILIIPLVATFVCSVGMKYVIGVPVAWLMEALTSFLQNMQGGSKFVFGMILGGFTGTDFGGPINKTACLVANGFMVDGIYEPEAVKLLGCMIPPMGIIVAYLIGRKKFTPDEREAVKACFPMGICMITECVIPLAMNDLWRVVLSSVVGCGVAGGVSMLLGIQAYVPHGGWFVIPTMSNPLGYVLCMVIGAVVMGVLLAILKRPLSNVDESPVYGESSSVQQSSMSLDDLSISNL